jgi:hypothetical protein
VPHDLGSYEGIEVILPEESLGQLGEILLVVVQGIGALLLARIIRE